MAMESATIHTAQLLERTRSRVRSPQGEYAEVQAQRGPMFAARLMRPPPTRPSREAGGSPQDTSREVVVRYEFLAQPVDFNGGTVTISASDRIYFVDAGPLGQVTIDVEGEPEFLNDGTNVIGWFGYGTVVEEASNG